MSILEKPASVLLALLEDHFDRVLEAVIVVRVARPEVVQRAQDVVVPARRKRESRQRRIHDFTRPVRTVEPVAKEELPGPGLCRQHFRCPRSVRAGVLAETLQHVDGRVERAVPSAPVSLAVPAAVLHLFAQEVANQTFSTRVIDAEPGEERQDEPRETRLASLLGRREIDAAVVPEPLVQEQTTRSDGPEVAWRKPHAAQQHHRVRGRDPLLPIETGCPATRAVLARQEPGAPSFAGHALLHGPPIGTWERQQVAHDLPADRDISREQPPNNAFMRCRNSRHGSGP